MYKGKRSECDQEGANTVPYLEPIRNGTNTNLLSGFL